MDSRAELQTVARARPNEGEFGRVLLFSSLMYRRVRVLECRRRHCNKKKAIRFHRRGGGETRRESSRGPKKERPDAESRALGGSEEEGESVKGSEHEGARKGERGGQRLHVVVVTSRRMPRLMLRATTTA